MRELFDLEISRTGEDRRGCFAVVEAPGFDGQLCDVYGEDEDDAAENAKALVEQVNAFADRQAEVERLRGLLKMMLDRASKGPDGIYFVEVLDVEIEEISAALGGE